MGRAAFLTGILALVLVGCFSETSPTQAERPKTPPGPLGNYEAIEGPPGSPSESEAAQRALEAEGLAELPALDFKEASGVDPNAKPLGAWTFDGVKAGQRYHYTRAGARLTEEVLRVDERSVTLRLTTWSEADDTTTETVTIPLDVLAHVKIHEPEFQLERFGASRYDAKYFRKRMDNGRSFTIRDGALQSNEILEIAGQRFSCARYGGVSKLNTTEGCVNDEWERSVSTRYPFAIREVHNGKPTFQLESIEE